jgi:hypothetical protein
MELTETIVARGHESILATHKTTLEITKEEKLSRKGDCIIAVSADKGLADLGCDFGISLRHKTARLTVLIEAGGASEMVNAFGSPQLTLKHATDMVVRKSDYVCSRTLAIRADKAACDLSRSLVGALKNPRNTVKVTFTVQV